ncbi:MAG TPA: Asp23/Gls24 family envelope stress response protein [Streptosporangiaceae bacterium]
MTQPGQSADSIGRLLDGPVRHLACGADVDELLEQAADGHAGQLTAHQRDCPHCQAALGEFSRVWEPVRSLAAEPIALPAAVRSVVASQIRKLTADVWHTLELADGGAIRIAARVVARIARDAARQVPGVRVVFGRTTQGRIAGLVEAATLRHRHPHAAVGVLGRTAVVDLAVAAEYGQELDAIARAVQHRAIAELRRNTGLKDISVNVTIDDVIA